VVVGDARTGQVLATLTSPKGGTFDGVTGAADDRTFVVDVRSVPSPAGSQSVSHAWYLLRIAPGTADPVRLTRLPITDRLKNAVIHGLALSPDGHTLALMYTPDMADGGAGGPTILRTYSMATGQPLRTWSGSQKDGSVCVNCDNTVNLTWLANGHTLAFLYPEAVLPQAVRTLDVNSPGNSLDADSRAIFPITAASLPQCLDGTLTSDGAAMLCGTEGIPAAKYGCASYGAAFNVYNTATEKLQRDLYRFRGSCAYAESSIVWAGSGTVAIGLLQLFTAAAPQRRTVSNGTSKTTDSAPSYHDELIFGLVTPGRFTPLRVTAQSAVPNIQATTLGLIAF
jgi:hypothetical protein